MRKERLIGKERYAGYLLIFMQGLILALLAAFFLNRQYMDVWRTYPHGGETLTVYLKNVAAEKEKSTQNFLLTAAEEQGLFVARMDGSWMIAAAPRVINLVSTETRKTGRQSFLF